MKYEDLLEIIHKHVSKSNDNLDDNKVTLVNVDISGKCYGCRNLGTRRTTVMKKGTAITTMSPTNIQQVIQRKM